MEVEATELCPPATAERSLSVSAQAAHNQPAAITARLRAGFSCASIVRSVERLRALSATGWRRGKRLKVMTDVLPASRQLRTLSSAWFQQFALFFTICPAFTRTTAAKTMMDCAVGTGIPL